MTGWISSRLGALLALLLIALAGPAALAQKVAPQLVPDVSQRVVEIKFSFTGAELLLYPTAIGWDPADSQDEKDRQREAWITVQRGHAVANGLPLLACNRVGFEPAPDGEGRGAQFWGSSFVAGPQGEILARANDDSRELLIADIDMARSEAVRRIWPFLRDRRIDAYDDLLKRFRD